MGVLSTIFLILSLCCFLPVIAGIDTAQGYGTGGCVMQGIKILCSVLCLLPFGLWFGWDVLGSGWFFLILLGVFILVIFVGSILLEMLGGVFYVIYGGRWLIIFILGLIFLGVGWATHPDEKEKEEDTSAMEIEEEEDELIEEEYADFVGGDDAEALIYKGFCYHDGMNGVKKDYEKALEYWRKAADLGNSEAQYLVGCYYLYGEGGTRDYKKSFEWVRKSAEGGYPMGQCLLGMFYQHGMGVSVDLERAKYWYKKSADQGFGEAKKRLKEL